MTLMCAVLIGLSRLMAVLGVPGEEGFPKLNAGQRPADNHCAHEGTITNSLEDHSGLAGGAVRLLGQFLGSVPDLL